MASFKLKNTILSKSRLMRGLQCDKNLFLTIFKPELETEADASTQSRFDEGNKVGLLAQKEFPGGVLIDAKPWETPKAVTLTALAMKDGVNAIYEATFQFLNFSSRIDILHRKNKTAPWKLVEVKSSTKVKEEHISDVAIQTWIARGSGVKIESCHLMHINNQCVAPHLEDLFTIEDITGEVENSIRAIEKKAKLLDKMIKTGEEPKVDIGPHCFSPHECGFIGECWKHVPTPSVFDIPSIGQRAWEYYKKGTIEIKDLDPKEFGQKQAAAIIVHQTGKRFIDKGAIEREISKWEWPLYFLDFETIGSAIPLYDGTRPYEQIPFQFSCHVLSREGKLSHFEFLQTDRSDPQEGIAKELIKGFKEKGSVVAYNKAFEAQVLKHLGEHFPKLKTQLITMVSRLVDPLPIFRSSVYDAKFLGSFSIKSVGPALIGKKLSYDNLEIGHGEAAQQAFMAMCFSDLSVKEKKKLETGLLEYCRQDTMAMVELVKWLYGAAGDSLK